MSDRARYQMAARLVAAQVVEAIAEDQSWTLNRALSAFAKSPLYGRLLDSTTQLWHTNPLDVALMFDYEQRGEPIPPRAFLPMTPPPPGHCPAR
jgi:hypothetical protein